MDEYKVVEYRNGKFSAVISGMGKNKGKWDSSHSRSAAYYHAAKLRIEFPKSQFKVEPGTLRERIPHKQRRAR